MSRAEVDDGWDAQVEAGILQLFEEQLGPDIADDARRYCPVKTGALKASIEHHIEDTTLVVSASGGGEDSNGYLYVSRRPGRPSVTGDPRDLLGERRAEYAQGTRVTRPVHHVEEGGRTYAAYVELGHRVAHPSTGVVGPEVVAPRPFLRPALFQQRGEA